MILDCILVDVFTDENGDKDWENYAFNFKNTDPNNKQVEIMTNGKYF